MKEAYFCQDNRLKETFFHMEVLMEPYPSDTQPIDRPKGGNPSLRKGGRPPLSAQLHPHRTLDEEEGKALDIKSWKNRRWKYRG